MARVTVEDCVHFIPNRFELTLLATKRSRDIAAGSPITLDRENDKNSVVALREIGEGTVRAEVLLDNLVRSLQMVIMSTDLDEEEPNEENQLTKDWIASQTLFSDSALDEDDSDESEQLDSEVIEAVILTEERPG